MKNIIFCLMILSCGLLPAQIPPLTYTPDIVTFSASGTVLDEGDAIQEGQIYYTAGIAAVSDIITLPNNGMYHVEVRQHILNKSTGDVTTILIGYSLHGWNCKFTTLSMSWSEVYETVKVTVTMRYRHADDTNNTPGRAVTETYVK